MRKGWKTFWAVCGIAGGVGLGLCIAGVSMGATVTAMNNRFPNGIGWTEKRSVTWYDNGETANAGDLDVSETFAGITDVEIDVTGLSVQIMPSNNSEVRLEATKVDSRLKLKYYQEGNELKIETSKKGLGSLAGLNNGSVGTVWVFLPDNVMEEVDINMGAGEIYAQELNVRSLSVDVGAGEAVIDNFMADEVDFQCGTGNLSASGIAKREVDIQCGVGSIDLSINGKETDYNYQIQCGIGDVSVGESSYSGIGAERKIQNNASRNMEIECGIGNIQVNFEQ